MKKIIFADKLDFVTKESFVAIIKKTEGEFNLLKELSNKLNFPDYFGFNWNALSDCLRDLNWIEEKEIVLFHEELPTLENNNLEIYIEILTEAINDWPEEDKHFLTVIFPEKYKNIIEPLNRMQ